MQRGKAKFKAQPKPLTIKLSQLNALPDGAVVNIDSLAKAKLVDPSQARARGVKILAGGNLDKKLTLELPASESVLEKFSK